MKEIKATHHLFVQVDWSALNLKPPLRLMSLEPPAWKPKSAVSTLAWSKQAVSRQVASLTMKAYHQNLVGYSWMHAIKSSSKLSSKLYLPLLLNIRVRSQLTTKNSTTLSWCIGFLKRYSPSELSPQFTQRVAPHARSAAPSAATTTQDWKTAANKNSTLPLKKYIFYLLQEPYESPWD